MKLRYVQLTLTCLLAAGFARAAWGQTQIVTGNTVQVGYQPLPTRTTGTPETGLKVSDDVLLHLGVGAELGYDSNVFYAPTPETAKGSGMLRIVPFAELTNATRAGVIPSGVFFDLAASLNYREYLSSDPGIQDQRAFMPSASAMLDFGSGQALSFLIGDGFSRTEDPPYQEGQLPYIRDTNLALAQLSWSPGGGRLATSLRYTNTIDYFESESDPMQLQAVTSANSMTNDLALDVSWKWLPKTAVFLNVDQQYISYFHTDEGKVNSFPLRAIAGLRGLITTKLSLNIGAGYGNGFYQTTATEPDGTTHPTASPSGIRGNLIAFAEITYRPTLETTTVLGYRHDFQNAIFGDFYYVDAVYLNFSQAIAGRLGFGLSARYESRSFQDVPVGDGVFISEHSNYWQVGANLDYRIRGSVYAGLSYTLMKNDSDYNPTNMLEAGSPDYTKQLVFARFGVTY
jgi:hypothetical protein